MGGEVEEKDEGQSVKMPPPIRAGRLAGWLSAPESPG